jgi:hypothetical protein
MYLRFITEFKNDNKEIVTGVFQAAGFLRENIHTFDYDKERLEKIKKWFNNNLAAPNKFSKSKSKNPANVSLSWFKSSAIEHLKWMYEMKEIIGRYDIHVEVIKRENPGYIVYEDEYQISTIPHRADKNKVI